MQVLVNIPHVNDISDSSKVDVDGNHSTNLKINCVLAPGDIARLHELIKYRIPLSIAIIGLQAEFDFKLEKVFEPIKEEEDQIAVPTL